MDNHNRHSLPPNTGWNLNQSVSPHHPSANTHHPSTHPHHSSTQPHHPSAHTHHPSTQPHHPSAHTHHPSTQPHHPSAHTHHPSTFHNRSAIGVPQQVPNSNGYISSTSPHLPDTNSLKRRSRTTFDRTASNFLEIEFAQNAYPDYTTREFYSHLLGVNEGRIQVWFQNKRSRSRGIELKRGPPRTTPESYYAGHYTNPYLPNIGQPTRMASSNCQSVIPPCNHCNCAVDPCQCPSSLSHQHTTHTSAPTLVYHQPTQVNITTQHGCCKRMISDVTSAREECTPATKRPKISSSTTLSYTNPSTSQPTTQRPPKPPILTLPENSQDDPMADDVFTDNPICGVSSSNRLSSFSLEAGTSSDFVHVHPAVQVRSRPSSLRLNSLELQLSQMHSPVRMNNFSPLFSPFLNLNLSPFNSSQSGNTS